MLILKCERHLCVDTESNRLDAACRNVMVHNKSSSHRPWRRKTRTSQDMPINIYLYLRVWDQISPELACHAVGLKLICRFIKMPCNSLRTGMSSLSVRPTEIFDQPDQRHVYMFDAIDENTTARKPEH